MSPTKVIVLLLAVFLGLTGSMFYAEITIGYAFDREIGNYFELADRASDATLKYQYFGQFVRALETNGLTEGQTAVFFQQPVSDLSQNYQVALSLLDRLETVSKMNQTSFEYQTAMQQITLQEFCWFPINIFKQGYYMNHGWWILALFPIDVQNRCPSK